MLKPTAPLGRLKGRATFCGNSEKLMSPKMQKKYFCIYCTFCSRALLYEDGPTKFENVRTEQLFET